ncbi:MAG: molybdate ABC transporter substrate-binding protein [Acidobacteria bacterium]|nr:molybdate ABC transporter substrate-binding protein [Acidobacteriota bacterium]
MLVALSVVLLVLLVVPQGAAWAQQGEVLVFAAASLSDVLRPIVSDFEAGGGGRVVLNLAASNVLARQIAAGARADLFVSADEAQMERVASDLVPGSRVALLSNSLAVVVPDDRPRTLASVHELTDPSFARIAVGDPAAVPAGAYARRYLEQEGLWDVLAPRLVPSGSVRLALAAVETGAVDAAIVYRTDAAVARRARLALSIPIGTGPRIVYPAALVRAGTHRAAARALLAHLQGPQARRHFEAAGFIVAGPAAPAGGR